ncbi:hypothetical protein HELRODRAFT_164842 [Helobdella robusta]|uniref:UPAR/Ly6 domain-containing protein n=1 Tax=Helobdella robusta TaxID=6412 RepID=T1EVV6_HELRO|nr:hypothetical protein HELRODRAFT_164842 [Helobdella robusta]ESN92743.1 hypothetical protein HELRODRAFT_164842 [Helobdella robusta]
MGKVCVVLIILTCATVKIIMGTKCYKCVFYGADKNNRFLDILFNFEASEIYYGCSDRRVSYDCTTIDFYNADCTCNSDLCNRITPKPPTAAPVTTATTTAATTSSTAFIRETTAASSHIVTTSTASSKPTETVSVSTTPLTSPVSLKLTETSFVSTTSTTSSFLSKPTESAAPTSKSAEPVSTSFVILLVAVNVAIIGGATLIVACVLKKNKRAQLDSK